MTDSKHIRDITFSCSAGEEAKHAVSGTMWHIIDATGVVQVKTDSNPYVSRRQGKGHQGVEFQEITILSSTTQDVKIAYGNGKLVDSESSISATVNVTPGAAASDVDALTDVTVPPETTTLIAAANEDRQSLVVMSLDTNTNECRVGGSGAAANKGAQVLPGGGMTFNNKAGVYAHNPHPTDSVVLSLTEESTP